jgi:hypothetical protein
MATRKRSRRGPRKRKTIEQLEREVRALPPMSDERRRALLEVLNDDERTPPIRLADALVPADLSADERECWHRLAPIADRRFQMRRSDLIMWRILVSQVAMHQQLRAHGVSDFEFTTARILKMYFLNLADLRQA